MAAVTAVVKDVIILADGYDMSAVNTTKRLRAVIFIDNGGTAVTTGSDTLTLPVDTILQARLRDGKTITLRDWSNYQPFQTSAAVGVASLSSTVSTNSIALALINTSDWSTGLTAAANGMVAPLGIYVLVDVT